jgi:hypothetical protein
MTIQQKTDTQKNPAGSPSYDVFGSPYYCHVSSSRRFFLVSFLTTTPRASPWRPNGGEVAAEGILILVVYIWLICTMLASKVKGKARGRRTAKAAHGIGDFLNVGANSPGWILSACHVVMERLRGSLARFQCLEETEVRDQGQAEVCGAQLAKTNFVKDYIPTV